MPRAAPQKSPANSDSDFIKQPARRRNVDVKSALYGASILPGAALFPRKNTLGRGWKLKIDGGGVRIVASGRSVGSSATEWRKCKAADPNRRLTYFSVAQEDARRRCVATEVLSPDGRLAAAAFK